VPPGGDTVALVVFNLLHYGYTAQVSALGLWLAVLALAPLVVAWVVGRLLRGRGVRWIGGVALAGLAVTGCSPTSGSSPSSGATSVPLDSKLFERVQVIGTKGTGPGHFNKPRSVTVDREDQLYVVDMTGRVQKFDRSGVWTLLWQMPETDKGKAKGMAGVGDGSVLVVEPHYHRVNRFSATGVLLGQWGHLGTNAGQLWFPRAVAVGPNGDCFVSEYGVVERVQRFRIEDGAFLGGFGNAGDGTAQFNRAEGVGVDRTGRVYVADSCNHRVQVFESDGRWVRSHGRAGPGVGEFGYPYDVQVDAEGHQFVCEFGNSRVQVLDAADRPVDLLGGPGQAPDRMNSPWSLCLDSQGNLYVADSQNHRVLKFVRRRAPVALAEAASNGGRESPLPGIRGTRLPARHDGDRTE
jgi:NHL repeat